MAVLFLLGDSVTGDEPVAPKPLYRDPVVFRWFGSYWMITDVWKGLAVYRSDDALTWARQKGNLLAEPGRGEDDQVKGGHPGVVVCGDRAYLFYFTHPGRRDSDGYIAYPRGLSL